jgi:hypothetical protein
VKYQGENMRNEQVKIPRDIQEIIEYGKENESHR